MPATVQRVVYSMPVVSSRGNQFGLWDLLKHNYQNSLSELEARQQELQSDWTSQTPQSDTDSPHNFAIEAEYAADLAHQRACRVILNFSPETELLVDWFTTVAEIADYYMPIEYCGFQSEQLQESSSTSQVIRIDAWLECGACFDLGGDFPEYYEKELINAIDLIDEQLVKTSLSFEKRKAFVSLRRHYVSELIVEFGKPEGFGYEDWSEEDFNRHRYKRHQFLTVYGEEYLTHKYSDSEKGGCAGSSS